MKTTPIANAALAALKQLRGQETLPKKVGRNELDNLLSINAPELGDHIENLRSFLQQYGSNELNNVLRGGSTEGAVPSSHTLAAGTNRLRQLVGLGDVTEIDTSPYRKLNQCVDAMVYSANTLGNNYSATFNDVKLTARPGDTAEDVMTAWHADQAKGQIDSWSPEAVSERRADAQAWREKVATAKAEVNELASTPARSEEQLVSDMKRGAEENGYKNHFLYGITKLKHPEEIKTWAQHYHSVEGNIATDNLHFAMSADYPVLGTEDHWRAATRELPWLSKAEQAAKIEQQKFSESPVAKAFEDLGFLITGLKSLWTRAPSAEQDIAVSRISRGLRRNNWVMMLGGLADLGRAKYDKKTQLAQDTQPRVGAEADRLLAVLAELKDPDFGFAHTALS